MGTSIGVIRFEDGLLMYTRYQNTTDVMHDVLRFSHEGYSEIPYEDITCKCDKDEIVEIATNYGMGYFWQGRACRYCRRLTDGFEPFEKEIIDGYPKWWPFKEE